GQCMGWPAATDPVEPLSLSTAEGLLLVGGTADAQTPLLWAEAVAEVTGSPLIVSEHFGHTVVFNGASDCVDQQVVDFIRERKSPVQSVCPFAP
ncbi:MAG: alpha/beta hydrolase, partial [Granulosicoccus sp.]|nr:alpha/beta hydrolase [Granulosicoccus sp.]